MQRRTMEPTRLSEAARGPAALASKFISRSSWLVLLIASLAPGSFPHGQQQPQINVTVKVVKVLATVRDKHHQIVSNLGKDDFLLEEDGRLQTITYFTRDTDLPLTLGLLVDTSESQRRVLDQERAASHNFLDDMLRENDQAFVIHFDREVELLQGLTSSQEKLANALQLLDATRPGGTLLYDAVFLASDEVIKKQQGRKALIVLSDGVDNVSKETLEDAIMTAQRADTVVYSILFADEQSYQNPFGGFGGRGMGRHGGMGRFPQEQRPDGRGVLERISKQTGGRLFEVSKKEPIDQIFSTIEEELRNQYSLGYTPASDVRFGYHKIHLATKQKDMTVQTRAGYYADR